MRLGSNRGAAMPAPTRTSRPVRRDGERLGERGGAQRQPVWHAQQLAFGDELVAGERALVVAEPGRVALGAQRRASRHALAAATASQRWSTDDLVADRPVRHV